MIKQIQFLSIFAVLCCLSVSGFAQQRMTAKAATSEMEEFVLQAKETNSEIALLLPAVQKVRDAAARSLATTLRKAQALATKVQSAGKKMTSSQYQSFQRELRTLEAELDKIAAGQNNSAGNPAPGSVGACHKSCHDAFGDGFGGGKGWNRFVCKVGCIKVNFPGGSAGG